MLISDTNKFIFYHVYKVAGTSVRHVLRPYVSKKQIILQNINYIAQTAGLDLRLPPTYSFHPKLSEVRDYMGGSFYEYYRFAFVRNPLDWQKSLYYFMIKNKRHHQHALISKFTFEDYLKWRIDSELKLQVDLISDSFGEILVSDIYKFENINDEFDLLKKKINVQGVLPHKNIAGSGKRVDISSSVIKEFNEAFKKDFDLLGYEVIN